MYNKTAIFALATLLASLTARAQPNTTSYGPASDRAGPIFGMSITIGTNAAETVLLNQVSFRNSDTGVKAGEGFAYLHIYDVFSTDNQYAPKTIGKLIAVSTNTVDFQKIEPNAKVTWHFDNTELDPSKEYHYVLSSSIHAATSDDFSNLTTAAFKLDTGNPYPGGRVWRAKSGWAASSEDWDMEFELAWMSKPVAEFIIEQPLQQQPLQQAPLKKIRPFIIVGGIGLLLIRARCKR